MGEVRDADACLNVNLSGKTLFVTGAGRGFGASFARAFAKAGAFAVVTDVDVPAAEEVAADILVEGGKAIALECDVCDAAAVDAAVAAAVTATGGVDFLINNAGRHLTKYSQSFAKLTRAEIKGLFDVNVMGVINCTMACHPAMAKRGGGAIINISSIAGFPSESPYGVSKLAVRGLTTAFAHDLGGDGIRVNAIAPGLIATDSAMADLDPALIARFANEMQKVKRRGEVADIVNMALFLCSPAASFVTGETIRVSGGYPAVP